MAEQQVHYPDAHEQQLPDSNPELNEDCKKEHEPFKLVIPIPIPNVIWNYKKSLIFWFNNRNELFDNNIDDKATFDMFIRGLPEDWGYFIANGIFETQIKEQKS